MNFKTTLILLAVLLAAGVAVFFTRSSSSSTDGTAKTTDQASGPKLFDFLSSDAQQISITPADGKAIVLKRDGLNWAMTSPVTGPADSAAPTEILSDITAMTSSGKSDVSGADGSATGLSPAQFTVVIDLKDGKTVKLAVGSKSSTGGLLYVQKDGDSQATLTQPDVYDRLDKSVNSFRRTKLLEVTTPQVEHLTIEQAGQPAVVLSKATTQSASSASTEKWTITAPTSMPADTAAVSDVLMALSNLQVTNWVAEDKNDLRQYGLTKPAVRVTFSTTQPSTTVDFGLQDVLKQNAYVTASNISNVVQVSASSVDSFKKTALDLRDKEVLSVEPMLVSIASIHTTLPATTQPTTRPASDTTLVLAHRPPPTSLPTTMAGTQPTSQPAPKPESKWIEMVDGKSEGVTDSRVTTLLKAFNPLKVTKYLATPTTMPATADHYTITLATAPPMVGEYVIELTDPGNSQPVVGRYNGLTFELERSVLDAVKADFKKPDETPSSASPNASPGFPSIPPG